MTFNGLPIGFSPTFLVSLDSFICHGGRVITRKFSECLDLFGEAGQLGVQYVCAACALVLTVGILAACIPTNGVSGDSGGGVSLGEMSEELCRENSIPFSAPERMRSSVLVRECADMIVDFMSVN